MRYKPWYLLMLSYYSRANQHLLENAKHVACYRCKRLVSLEEVVYGTENTGPKGFLNGAKTGIHKTCGFDTLLPSEVFYKRLPLKNQDFLVSMHNLFFQEEKKFSFGRMIAPMYPHDPYRKTLIHPVP